MKDILVVKIDRDDGESNLIWENLMDEHHYLKKSGFLGRKADRHPGPGQSLYKISKKL